MATTVASPALAASVTANLTGGAPPAPSQSPVNHSYNPTLTVGAAAGQSNKVYSAPFTVTTGTPLALDLTTLVDPLGGALNFSAVTSILITNDSTTAGQDFTIGGGTNGLFTAAPNIVAANGGAYFISNPTAQITVDGTHKILTIAVAAGTGVGGKVTIVGR
jgi:hypothetical protein